jgi:hypothetical protein
MSEGSVFGVALTCACALVDVQVTAYNSYLQLTFALSSTYLTRLTSLCFIVFPSFFCDHLIFQNVVCHVSFRDGGVGVLHVVRHTHR